MAKVNWDKGLNDWLDNKWNPAPDIHIDNLQNDDRALTPSKQQYSAPVNNTYNAPVNQPVQPQSNIFNNLFNAIFHANDNADNMFTDQTNDTAVQNMNSKQLQDFINQSPKMPQDNYNKLIAMQTDKENSEAIDNIRNPLLKGLASLVFAPSKQTPFLNRVKNTGVNTITGGAANLTQTDTGNGAKNFVADMLGSGLGFVAPQPGSAQSLGNVLDRTIGQPVVSKLGFLGNSTPARYTQSALKTGAEFAGLNAVESGLQGKDIRDVGKSAGEGLLQGALFGAGGKFLGDIAPKIKNAALPDWKTTYESELKNPSGKLSPILNPKVELTSNLNTPTLNTPVEPVINPKPPLSPSTLSMGERDFSNVGNRNVKSYQYENPQVKPFVQNEANIMLGELRDTTPASRIAVSDNYKGESGPGIDRWMGTDRQTSDAIANIKDITGASYDKIRTGLQNLIDDNGKENNALSKKIELIIDDRLTNGYNDNLYSGMDIPPNNDYLALKGKLESGNIKPPVDNIKPPLEGKPNMMDLQQFNTTKPNSDLTTADNPLAKRGKFVDNSIQNSVVTPKEVKDYYKDNPDYYIPKSNNESWNNAQDAVNNNFKVEHDKLIRRQSMETADDTAKAIAVYKKYIDDGNMQGAIEWAGQIKGKIRNTAQALQFMSTLKRFTPEWTLNKAQAEIEKTWTPKQRDILDNAPTGTKEEIAKKYKIPYISDDVAKKITDMSTKIGSMEDGRAKREAIANLNDVVHSQIPASWRDKVNSMQTLSMLSGTKTPIRNIIGNTLYKGVDNIKEIPRTMIDAAISPFTGQRTATLPDFGAQLKGYAAGSKEAFLDFKNNVNTKNINDKFELNRTSPWDKNGNLFNRAMSQAERVNRLALDDRPAMTAAYEGEMARQRKLAKINNVPFDEAAAKEKADLKSLTDTFSNKSAIADLATSLKRNANILSNHLLSGNIGKPLDQATKDEYAKWGAGDLLIKFAKTPANIVGKQIEYSPINIVAPFAKALKDGIKGNGFDQEAFANNLAKGLTGTGIMALGAMLHNTMTTDADKNINKSNLDNAAGLGSFKLNISAVRRLMSGEKTDFQKGDLITSYDWANPISVLLASGASMAKAKDGKTIKGVGQVAGDLISAMNEGVNSIIDQPMNQGLRTWVQQGDLGKGITQSLAALPQTFVPSIVNQFRQLTDNTSRETYDPNIFKQGLNQMANRIPGLEQTLPQKIDIMGESKNTFQNNSNNLFNVLFNPAITTRYQPTQAQENAANLFKLTGNSGVLPQLADKTIDVDGKKIKLTPEQFNQYQVLQGKGASDILSNINVGSDGLNKLAKDTSKAISDNSQAAKIKVLQDNNLPLPLSITKDNISGELTNNRSKDAKAIRDRVKEISDSDMTTAEKQQALDDLLGSASRVTKPKPKKKTTSKSSIWK